jgi:hypothetical protein
MAESSCAEVEGAAAAAWQPLSLQACSGARKEMLVGVHVATTAVLLCVCWSPADMVTLAPLWSRVSCLCKRSCLMCAYMHARACA